MMSMLKNVNSTEGTAVILIATSISAMIACVSNHILKLMKNGSVNVLGIPGWSAMEIAMTFSIIQDVTMTKEIVAKLMPAISSVKTANAWYLWIYLWKSPPTVLILI